MLCKEVLYEDGGCKMGTNFDVNTPNLKQSVTQYQDIAKALADYVTRLEAVRRNPSNHSYSDIRGALVALEQDSKDSVNQLKNMGSALSSIIQLYESAEKRLLGVDINTGKKDPKDILKMLDKLLESLIKMLKGMGNDCCKYGGDPINFATGNFIYHREYLRLKGLYPIEFKMSYNSMEKQDGALGKGWVHNYEIYITKEDQRAILHWSDGKEETFVKVEDGMVL